MRREKAKEKKKDKKEGDRSEKGRKTKSAAARLIRKIPMVCPTLNREKSNHKIRVQKGMTRIRGTFSAGGPNGGGTTPSRRRDRNWIEDL